MSVSHISQSAFDEQQAVPKIGWVIAVPRWLWDRGVSVCAMPHQLIHHVAPDLIRGWAAFSTPAEEKPWPGSSPGRRGEWWQRRVRCRSIPYGEAAKALSYPDNAKEAVMQHDELTPEDRIAAEELASLLGVPCDELIEEFANLSPEQQAELEELLAQANEVLPAMAASLDRMSDTLASTSAQVRTLAASMADTDRRLAKIEQAIEGGVLNFREWAPPMIYKDSR